MNYHNITNADMLNGDGLRVVLWCSGCPHACVGCQNPQTWNKDSGVSFDIYAEVELLSYLEEDYIDGVTFSGGDPLCNCNVETVTRLAKTIKEKFKDDKSIWIYTGFNWEDISDLEIMKYADVVVDGPFVLQMLDVSLQWRGSSNQRVIDVQKTLANNNNIVLHCE